MSMPQPVFAAFAVCPGFSTTPSPPWNLPKDTSVTFSIDSNAFGKSGGFFWFKFQSFGAADHYSELITNSGGKISVAVGKGNRVLNPSSNARYVEAYWTENRVKGPSDHLLCSDSYQVSEDAQGSCSIQINPPGPSVKDSITATVVNNSEYTLHAMYNPPAGTARHSLSGDISPGGTRTYSLENNGVGAYTFWMENYPQGLTLGGKDICGTTFYVTTEGGPQTGPQSLGKVCDFVPADKRSECQRCFVSEGGAWTAVGCISTKPEEFVKDFLRLGIGIAGGIAFLLILFGGFQILTSAGNPERLAGGKELVGAAISGLLLIIFSLFLLKVIGVDILGIPGFE